MAKRTTAQLDFGIIVTDPDEYRRQRQRKQRSCLRCQRSFSSRGPGHRICWRCHESPDWRLPSQFESIAF